MQGGFCRDIEAASQRETLRPEELLYLYYCTSFEPLTCLTRTVQTFSDALSFPSHYLAIFCATELIV